MRVLAVVHGELVGPAIFGEVVEACGHELEIWYPASCKEPIRPPDTYGAALVFGGVMDAHEETLYPWLRTENAVLQGSTVRVRPRASTKCLQSGIYRRLLLQHAGTPRVHLW